MHKNKILSVVTAFVMAASVIACPVSASAMELPDPLGEQYYIYPDAGNPFNENGRCILRFGSNEASVSSISVNTAERTVTFEGLSTSRMDVDDNGWNLIFSGRNLIRTELVNESLEPPLLLTVLANSTLEIGNTAFGQFELGSNTVSDKPFETESISTEGPIVLSNSTTSSSTDEASAPEGSGDGNSEGGEASTESPVQVVQNSVVDLGDGGSIESVLSGSYTAILPVAFQNSGALAESGNLAEGATVLPTPTNISAYSASVSEFNSTDSPASAEVIDSFAKATGQDLIGCMNIDLVDRSVDTPTPGSGWNFVDHEGAVSGAASVAVLANGVLTARRVEGAIPVVVGLNEEATGDVSICGVTEGGVMIIQADLDTNPHTATFYTFRGNGAYGICQNGNAGVAPNPVRADHLMADAVNTIEPIDLIDLMRNLSQWQNNGF